MYKKKKKPERSSGERVRERRLVRDGRAKKRGGKNEEGSANGKRVREREK